jgi:hypothetical protein
MPRPVGAYATTSLPAATTTIPEAMATPLLDAPTAGSSASAWSGRLRSGTPDASSQARRLPALSTLNTTPPAIDVDW